MRRFNRTVSPGNRPNLPFLMVGKEANKPRPDITGSSEDHQIAHSVHPLGLGASKSQIRLAFPISNSIFDQFAGERSIVGKN